MMEILLVGKDLQHNTALSKILNKFDTVKVVEAANVQKAMEYVQEHHPQLIIFDYSDKDSFDGVEITKKLEDKGIYLLFLSSLTEKDYEVSYMVKPFDAKELPQTLSCTLQQIIHPFGHGEEETASEDVIFIRQNQILEKVFLSDIEWVESDGNYAIIHTRHKKFVLRLSLSKLKERLPDDRFQQINKGNIVQIALINNINLTTNEIQLNGNSQLKLSLGRTYKKELFQRLRQL